MRLRRQLSDELSKNYHQLKMHFFLVLIWKQNFLCLVSGWLSDVLFGPDAKQP